jgi:hypothetical protein
MATRMDNYLEVTQIKSRTNNHGIGRMITGDF